jgi:hypothetical protein
VEDSYFTEDTYQTFIAIKAEMLENPDKMVTRYSELLALSLSLGPEARSKEHQDRMLLEAQCNMLMQLLVAKLGYTLTFVSGTITLTKNT